MKKIYLILFLLLVPIVIAEEKGINGDIKNFTINTWIQDNKSYCKVGFETKDVYDNDIFEKEINQDENYSKERFTIRFTKDLNCNLTTEGMLLDFFTECETDEGNKSCKEAFIQEEANRIYYQNLSEFNSGYPECLKGKTYLNGQLNLYRDKYNESNVTVYNLKEENKKVRNSRIWYVIAIWIIMLGYHKYKTKYGESKGSKELGGRKTIGETTKFLDNLVNKLRNKKEETTEIKPPIIIEK